MRALRSWWITDAKPFLRDREAAALDAMSIWCDVVNEFPYVAAANAVLGGVIVLIVFVL